MYVSVSGCCQTRMACFNVLPCVLAGEVQAATQSWLSRVRHKFHVIPFSLRVNCFWRLSCRGMPFGVWNVAPWLAQSQNCLAGVFSLSPFIRLRNCLSLLGLRAALQL